MKTAIIAAAACVAGASAFVAPSSFSGAQVAVRSASTGVVSMSGDQVGADVETKGIWDPWGYAKDSAALGRYRAAELKHGRVAMLATLGFLVGELWHPLYDGKISGGLAALQQVPAAAWLQIVAAIGIIELTIGKQRDDLPAGQIGEFGQAFNPFSEEPEKFEALQLKELKNGRLAMVASAGLLVQNFLTGQSPLEQIASGHISPFNDGQGYF